MTISKYEATCGKKGTNKKEMTINFPFKNVVELSTTFYWLFQSMMDIKPGPVPEIEIKSVDSVRQSCAIPDSRVGVQIFIR